MLEQVKLAAFLLPFYVLFYAWLATNSQSELLPSTTGLVVDPRRGIVAFPKDLSNYALSDYFALKISGSWVTWKRLISRILTRSLAKPGKR